MKCFCKLLSLSKGKDSFTNNFKIPFLYISWNFFISAFELLIIRVHRMNESFTWWALIQSFGTYQHNFCFVSESFFCISIEIKQNLNSPWFWYWPEREIFMERTGVWTSMSWYLCTLKMSLESKEPWVFITYLQCSFDPFHPP